LIVSSWCHLQVVLVLTHLLSLLALLVLPLLLLLWVTAEVEAVLMQLLALVET
jgi:hypothetical protein